jgi:hypothetical protein
MVGLGAVLAATELLSLRRQISAAGHFSWANDRTRFRAALSNGTIALLDAVCDYPRFLYLLSLQALCGVFLVFSGSPTVRLCLLLVVLCVHLLTMIRSPWTDGSDQMLTIVLLSLVCFYITPDPMLRKAALWFLALQAILAYVTAGVLKLWSKAWLNGTMLQESANQGLAREVFGKFLPKGVRINQLLCWSVIALECSFPLVVVPWPVVCVSILCAGILLHLINAVALGLPRFIFTFVAAYPAIFSFACDVQPALRAYFT